MKSDDKMTIRGKFLEQKRNKEITFCEEIDSLCRKHTILTESDVELIHEYAGRLTEKVEQLGKDCFINCVRASGNDAITVAAAYAENSLYDYTTIGAIISDADEPAVLRTLRCGLPSSDIRAMSYTTTEGHNIVQNCYPIENCGKIIGVVLVERDITKEDIEEWERIVYHDPDIKSYPYLRNLTRLAECVNDAVIVLNQDMTVVYRNDKAQHIYHAYGYIHDIHAKKYNDFSFHGPIHVGPGIERAEYHLDLRCAGKYFEIGEYCYYEDAYFYIIILKDITQEKEKEENLIYKSVVVREAHHRVKNNLQTVYNLLDMQRRRQPEERIKLVLNEAMNRIASIASAYELLSKEGTEVVNILDLLNKITINFKALVDSSNIALNIEVKGDETYATTDDATDIALVVNELLQNTFKHAFNHRGFGNVSVTVLKRPLYSEIIVSDNGEGMDSNKIENAGEGLGHQIAENIVKQKLKGQIHYLSDLTGTSVVFTFRCIEK